MKTLKAKASAPSREADLEFSLLIPARSSTHALEATVRQAHEYLESRFGPSFEIVLIPNPAPGAADRSVEVAGSLARRFSNVNVVPHISPPETPGKGAALRTGFQHSRGKVIAFTDADLPYDLEFFDEALIRIRNGFDLVTGNRRLPFSHFHVPVDLLKLAYKRHRLGLWFNACVRRLLPIRTTDTQAGIKAMSRELASRVFAKQTCPGFFFDLEIFLTAIGDGFEFCELPVTLHLNSEKSTVRILRESILASVWLTKITVQYRRGYYGEIKARLKPQGMLSRYPGATAALKLFLFARWHLTPYDVMSLRLPRKGTILDVGCGHGLLSLTLALGAPARAVVGVDHDQNRLELARQASRDLDNVRFLPSIPETPNSSYAGIAMIDFMHYFDPHRQEEMVREAFERLQSGGTLILREVDPDGGWISNWNRLYEKLATAVGFTRSERKTALHFRTQAGWKRLLKSAGFRVSAERCSSRLFADILYVCERRA